MMRHRQPICTRANHVMGDASIPLFRCFHFLLNQTHNHNGRQDLFFRPLRSRGISQAKKGS